MSESIQETVEALNAVFAITNFIVERAKDGVQLADAGALVEKLLIDEEFKKLIANGFAGLSKIPAEMKDLDEGEIAQLAGVGIASVFGVIKALKK